MAGGVICAGSLLLEGFLLLIVVFFEINSLPSLPFAM